MATPSKTFPPLISHLLEGGKVVVAIPAHNEEKGIGVVVVECLRHVKEVWVIDDGSSDKTQAAAEKAGAKVIRHPSNQGKGKAIQTAMREFLEGRFEILILMDADGQHDPVHLPRFLESVRDGDMNLVLGNRMLHTAEMPPVRRWTNRFMSWLISMVAGQSIPDSQCGYRLLHRRFVENFHPTTSRFDLESEMLFQAARLGMKIESVPISTIYRGSSSHIDPVVDTLRFIRLLWRYRKK